MQTMVKTYRKDQDYRRDAKKLSARGWRVVSVVQEKRQPGCARIGCLGLFAFLFPPRSMWVVTYEQTR